MAFQYKRRAQEDVQARATGSGTDFKGFLANEYSVYGPKDGDNWIRILPPTWDDARHYGIDVYVHYGIGPDRASVLCNAKMFSTHCPICEARARAQKAGDEELAKELAPSGRVLIWLIDRKEPSKGPLLWAMPYSVDKEICGISTDKQTGEYFELDNPTEGYDVTFTKTGKGIATKYGAFQVARRPSSVDHAHIDFIVNNPLHGTLLERTYDEVKSLYEGLGAAPTAEAPAPAPTNHRHTPAPSPTSAALGGDDIPWETIDPVTGEVTTGTGPQPVQAPAKPGPAPRRAMPPAAAASPPAPPAAANSGQSAALARAAALRAKFAK